MRAGLSTIQQTLTPEAATILNQSIAEAARRNHSQTTPLHVASTLLAAPNGYLRQACSRSHPNSSHPLQCRALELCFTVALDRLPSAQNLSSSSSSSLEPPISNALMAALKRAQAHQRRGCPEQQQQPLLAVKVELEQLIVSILDDPSVSRVMREASFSSPAVKATIEQSLNAAPHPVQVNTSAAIGFRNLQSSNRNLYMNPRLQQGNGIGNGNGNASSSSNLNLNLNSNTDQIRQQGRKEEVKKVLEILMRTKKSNPVLVGESETELVVRELLLKIEKKELGEASLRNIQIISLEKEFGADRSQILVKIKELGGSIDSRMSGGGGVIVDLGDLKWLVEQPGGFGGAGSGHQIVSEMGKAVAEMVNLLARFGEGNGRLWLIGTATCETYLRCQVYHPSMENDWDLQAVPIAARAALPGLFPRLRGNVILSSSVESLTPLKGFPTMNAALSRRPSENVDPAQRTKCCPQCTQSYEQELAKLVDIEKSSGAKQESTRQTLPQWLQIAKSNNDNVKAPDQAETKDQEVMIKQKTDELQRKWNDTCSRLHPSFHHIGNSQATLSMTNLYCSSPLGRQAFQPKLQQTRNLGGALQTNLTSLPQPSERVASPPRSPVGTDLVLGHPKITVSTQKEQPVRDFIAAEPQDRFFESDRQKLACILDDDSFKSLFKGLTEKVSWQKEAASVVAANVIHCRSGNSKRQGLGWKGDTWLLFAGSDRVGKKKMAMALSELLCRTAPISFRLGSRGSYEDEEVDVNFRGKTTLDRVVEAVQRNPSSVILLEDIDKADMLVQGSIKRAIERGRLPDSHGREVNLKNVIFILTANGLPEDLKDSSNLVSDREERLASLASKGWQLQLSVGAKTVKRRPDWLLHDENRVTKSRTEVGSGLSFDLNEAATVEDDSADGSRNSSDLTFEHDHEHTLLNKQSLARPLLPGFVSIVDEAIVFKPIDFCSIQSKVASTIVSKFSDIVNDGRLIEVDTEALEQIVSGVWFGGTGLEEWAEKVLVPSFHNLKSALKSNTIAENNKNAIVRLVSVVDSERQSGGNWLPSKITVVGADGL